MEVQLVAGKRDRIVDADKGGRMPADGNIDIVEHAGTDHEALGGAALLGGAAVIADPARNVKRMRRS